MQDHSYMSRSEGGCYEEIGEDPREEYDSLEDNIIQVSGFLTVMDLK